MEAPPGVPTVLDAAPSDETPLRRNRNFQLLWSGSALAFLGREITDLAYPLVVLAATGSAAWAGTFGAVQMLVALLVGLPAGALVDAYDRRVLLITMESVRATASASVLVAVALDAVTLPHLLAAGVAVGAVQPLGGSARMLLVRSVVPPRQLTAALTQEEIRTHAAALSGPPLAGLLYATATALPFLGSTVSFLVSAFCAVFVRPPARDREAGTGAGKGRLLRHALAGPAQLWRVPALRAATVFAAALNLVTAPLILVVIVVLTRQGASPTVIGLTSAGLALGGLAGTLLVRPLHRALGPGTLMLWLGGTAVATIAALALPWGSWWLAAALFLLGLGGPSMRVLVDILIFRQIPDEQRGRAISAFMTILTAGAAVGLFLSGQLLRWIPSSIAILSLAGLLAITVVVAATDRRIRTARWPDESP
ncbi:MFS transporter [Micromonospora rifamycinica]|uniref:Predicted arabinose efflux permease, MFS family n=1 Tax=Micromonospora rifamycinica TaxID=291594 RepID=A0A125Q202_9ACTN|nr:MFS transporter [Micromonospora rifamycinica]KWV33770.1 MFS transporter [Micromonospora rifamycinica]SCG64810.1 Predicted arabinose efflux permease, MFS family [Micromonospora rifamycinica]